MYTCIRKYPGSCRSRGPVCNNCSCRGTKHSHLRMRRLYIHGPQSLYFATFEIQIIWFTVTCHRLNGRGIESRWGDEIFTRSDRPWGPHSIQYNGNRVSLAEVKQSRRGLEHPLNLARKLKKEYCYTSTPLLALHDLF
jgi:hypothetical protein